MKKYWLQKKVTWDCGHIWIQTFTDWLKKHPEYKVEKSNCPFCNESKIRKIENKKVKRLIF